MPAIENQYTLSELTKGLDVTLIGDPNHVIRGVCTIQAGSSDHIAFLMNPLYKKFLKETAAGAVILTAEDAKEFSGNGVIARDPYYIYTQVAKYFNTRSDIAMGCHPSVVVGRQTDIHASARIAANCVIGHGVSIAADVCIGPGSVISDGCVIGEASMIDANVTLYHGVHLGKRVVIASGTVIGSDGFGIAKHKGVWHKVPQLGGVVIHDDVEIGANCTIDRGAIEDTIIERGVKLDNLIQIGHNVRIGEHTAIAGCVGISGSTTIGSNCLIGGRTGFAGHITIADNVIITGGTAVTKSIAQQGIYSSGVGGIMTNLEWRKNSARVNRLSVLYDRVKQLENTLEALLARK